ncbi:MAG: DUF115 domain-containing protein [Spirochaetaceae bacterium]|jgi:hypothetical protein|nr:DUF115 domain-containing protein [Spirochaetaceae bacterium]
MTGLTYGLPVPAKTGAAVPIFADGKAMYSLYDPGRDAAIFADQGAAAAETAGAGFILVCGLGDGSHVAALLEKIPDAGILVAEHSGENIAFLQRQFDFSRLAQNNRMNLCTVDELEATIPRLYVPALHGGFLTLYQQAWKRFHTEDCARIAQGIDEALENVGADFATQAMFGKIWMRNFFLNLQTAAGRPSRPMPPLPVHKKAVVIAAGPTLDRTAASLEPGEFVIATDTACPALLRCGIVPGVVCTIDGQSVSARHFMQAPRPQTLLVADLCCNPGIPRRFIASGNPVLWTASRHPLCSLFLAYLSSRASAAGQAPPEIAASSGTVTLYALDFAVRMGWKNIRILGADFSYPGGKPYARGTYLDDRFHGESLRTRSAEQSFSALMYRGKTRRIPPLSGETPDSAPLTTSLMDGYFRAAQNQIASCASSDGVSIASESARPIARYPRKNNAPSRKPPPQFFGDFGRFAADFTDRYAGELRENLQKTAANQVDRDIFLSCLPLGAWLSKNSAKKFGKIDVFSLLQLANKLILRYNSRRNGSENS